MTICPEERCTGCGACQSACPADCINLALNRAGDRVAVIDESRCTRCGKCSRICPVLHPPVLRESRTALAAYAVEAQVRQSSASGGAAAVLARQVVESGGCAYGAAFTAPTTVKLVRVDAPAQLSRLQGSKYVHAATGSAYRKVQSDLKAGRQVLFTGTPCQVAGLYAYLGSDPPRLTTCDLVCHGVPEADTLNAYLQTELNPAAIARLTFRDGDGWVMKAYGRDGGVLRRMDLKNSLYYNGFMEGYLYRTGCYTCPYATEKRVADLTLGDFWGIGEETPYPNAAAELKKGLSLILVHTDKGQALLNACAPALVTTVRTPAEAVKKIISCATPPQTVPRPDGSTTCTAKRAQPMPLPTAMRKSGAPCVCGVPSGIVRHCWPCAAKFPNCEISYDRYSHSQLQKIPGYRRLYSLCAGYRRRSGLPYLCAG